MLLVVDGTKIGTQFSFHQIFLKKNFQNLSSGVIQYYKNIKKMLNFDKNQIQSFIFYTLFL